MKKKPVVLRPYQIAAIRALLGRDVVMVDEEHHGATPWRFDGLCRVGRGMVIGFTATPERADDARLTDRSSS